MPYASQIANFLKDNPELNTGECSYSVDEVSESFVVESMNSKLNHSGYLNSFNLVKTLVKPPANLEDLDEELLNQYFYKGGFVNSYEKIQKLTLKRKIKEKNYKSIKSLKFFLNMPIRKHHWRYICLKNQHLNFANKPKTL